NFDLRFDKDTPAGWAFLKQTGMNLFIQGQSGRAYTPLSEQALQNAESFSKNAPFQVTVDARFNHFVRLGTRRIDLSVAGTNVFSNYVINRVDRVTGRGRVFGFGEYDPRNPNFTVTDYTHTSAVDDPSNYGAGAQWRFSLDYDF